MLKHSSAKYEFSDEVVPSTRVMTTHERALLKMLSGRLFSADHPISDLNPAEWFQVKQVKIEGSRIFIAGEHTCWFSINMCRPRSGLEPASTIIGSRR